MNRRETQRTYCPGALFSPRWNGLPGKFCTCMIIGWIPVWEKVFDPNRGKISKVRGWSAIFLYSENDSPTIGKLSWNQIEKYCNLL